jgi:hypothetical protein
MFDLWLEMRKKLCFVLNIGKPDFFGGSGLQDVTPTIYDWIVIFFLKNVMSDFFTFRSSGKTGSKGPEIPYDLKRGFLTMRQFIRHPSDIPIDFHLNGIDEDNRHQLKNYSEGGLCFVTDQWVEPDAEIEIAIPCVSPVFKSIAQVVWCKSLSDGFEVGVRFKNDEADYVMRMVEQICHIEEYRQEQSRLGRTLTSQEAALEWIERYASEFPR